jgi:hypoxanthine phosphoribosyltransferase
MDIVQLHDKRFEVFIDKAIIANKVAAFAKQIDADYKGLNPLFLGILNGSFIFAADLFRHISTPAEISFIKLASYKGTTSTGNIVTAIGLEENIAGRHIVIVEDIVDTGRTLHSFLPQVQQQQPASVQIACFLSKPEARVCEVVPRYMCFEIQDTFVVGYGLDYDGQGRNLPHLYRLCD